MVVIVIEMKGFSFFEIISRAFNYFCNLMSFVCVFIMLASNSHNITGAKLIIRFIRFQFIAKDKNIQIIIFFNRYNLGFLQNLILNS